MNTNIGVAVLLMGLGCVFAASNDVIMPGPPITSSSEHPLTTSHSTTHEPPSPSPTSPVTPTKSTPTPAPTKPSSTTNSPTPAPTKPSTTTSSPTPTPTKPSTTPTVPTKPTDAPTTTAPLPDTPEVGDWNVTMPGTNNTCILAKMAVQIEITYPFKNGTKTFKANVPKDAEANGACGDKIQNLSISWPHDQNKMNLQFTKNATTSEASLSYLLVVLNEPSINATAPLVLAYNKSEFNVPANRSYKCMKEQDIALTPISFNATNAVLRVSHVQVQAFKNVTHVGYDDAIDCINSTPDIVPIAVGCALAALVVIVLLAYLYGRRRSQARGYLSM